MTPEQTIAEISALKVKVQGLEEWLKSIDSKQDELIAIANKGRGAWRTMLILGGIVGGLGTIASGALWVWQHIRIHP